MVACEAALLDQLVQLQNSVFEASSVSATEGALLRRVQVSRAHIDVVFPTSTDGRMSMEDMATKRDLVQRDAMYVSAEGILVFVCDDAIVI